MKNKEFNVGDYVYLPTYTNSVCQLKHYSESDYHYIIQIDKERSIILTVNGKIYSSDINPSIFHANQSNRKRLNELYGCEFENVPDNLNSNEVFQKLGLTNTEFALCSVSNLTDGDAGNVLKPRVIVSADLSVVEGGKFRYKFTDVEGIVWNYAKFISYVKIGELNGNWLLRFTESNIVSKFCNQ